MLWYDAVILYVRSKVTKTSLYSNTRYRIKPAADATLELLQKETPEFVPTQRNSPGLNPADYSVWRVLREKVYKIRITDLNDVA